MGGKRKWKAMRLLNDINSYFVMTMSHWLLAKLLSFSIDIEDEIRVIEVRTYKTKSHMTKESTNES